MDSERADYSELNKIQVSLSSSHFVMYDFLEIKNVSKISVLFFGSLFNFVFSKFLQFSATSHFRWILFSGLFNLGSLIVRFY